MSKQGTSNPSQGGSLTGKRLDSEKVVESNSHLLEEILNQLKIMNKQLSLLTEVEIEDHEIN